MIGNLQILRAFAATGVVFLHSHATVFGVHTEFHGVALFFVISGYLMCRVRYRPAGKFIADRFWRIVPAYWLATALMLTTFGMWTYWPFYHLVLSFLFIPHTSPSGLHPILGVGWTLNFEVYFYLIFAVAIWINRRFAPLIATMMIGTIYFATPHLTSNEAANFYYGGYLVWYFVGGMGIWYVDSVLAKSRIIIRLPRWALPTAVVAYMALTILAAKGLSYPFSGSLMSVALPAVLFVLFIAAARFGTDINHPFMMLLGNASYGCYLMHTIFIELMRHRGIQIDGSLTTTTVILVSSWTVAVVWYLTVEKAIALLKRRVTA